MTNKEDHHEEFFGRNGRSHSNSSSSNLLVFREYEESTDREDVHKLFIDGMISLAPVMTKVIMKHRLQNMTTFKHPIFTAIIIVMISSVPMFVHSKHESLLSSSLSTSTSTLSLAIPTITILVTLLWYICYAYIAPLKFQEYIQASLQGDLNNIPEIYQSPTKSMTSITKPSCSGVFLVAAIDSKDSMNGTMNTRTTNEYTTNNNRQDRTKNEVFGMVGGEYKHEISLRDKILTFELRRMSVHKSMRGLGIGRQLLTFLEKELMQQARKYYENNTKNDIKYDNKKNNNKMAADVHDLQPNQFKIMLYTSNLQYAAHRMYEKHGFIRKTVQSYGDWPDGFELWYYEKIIPIVVALE